MSCISNHNKIKFLHKKFIHKKVPVDEKSVMAISFTQLSELEINTDESANFQPGHTILAIFKSTVKTGDISHKN